MRTTLPVVLMMCLAGSTAEGRVMLVPTLKARAHCDALVFGKVARIRTLGKTRKNARFDALLLEIDVVRSLRGQRRARLQLEHSRQTPGVRALPNAFSPAELKLGMTYLLPLKKTRKKGRFQLLAPEDIYLITVAPHDARLPAGKTLLQRLELFLVARIIKCGGSCSRAISLLATGNIQAHAGRLTPVLRHLAKSSKDLNTRIAARRGLRRLGGITP